MHIIGVFLINNQYDLNQIRPYRTWITLVTQLTNLEIAKYSSSIERQIYDTKTNRHNMDRVRKLSLSIKRSVIDKTIRENSELTNDQERDDDNTSEMKHRKYLIKMNN